MESKIVSQDKNPFLEREEMVVEMKSETAPSYDDVRAAVDGDANLIVVKKVAGNFGKHIFVADVVVYDNVEAKKKVEMIPKKVRKKMIEEKKAADEEAKKVAAAEAEAVVDAPEVVVDTPIEEVKEEVKSDGD